MSKGDMLNAVGRKLSRDEVESLYRAISHGYKPFAPAEVADGAAPGWEAPAL